MNYFNLYSNIFLTKGANRVLISDLQRNHSESQSLELYEIINEFKANSIEEVLGFYDEESKELAQEYLDFLLEREYGFISSGDWDKNFAPLSLEHKDYHKISNLFMERNDLMISVNLVQSIENLGISHLVICCKCTPSLKDFLKLEADFEHSALESIEIFAPFNATIDEKFIKHLNQNTSRIYSLIFYNCEKLPFEAENNFNFDLLFTPQDLKISACGKVSIDYFDTNITKVLEAVNHNSCLHKKIGIDAQGNIKNCPTMPQTFGNINQTTLEEAISHQDFKKYWNLTKDHIAVCKDCEFRYMCIDNRIPIERIDGSFYNSLECSYNPYISKWVGDLDYYTLIGTGVYSNEKGFSKDVNKIAQINEQIWRDS
ncbi:MAG: grasp-with-spasm system SPASM domain peptide maturase [Pedobacter sp.]|nr:MAG: grasp-with-spasm system SPASM domain peptide maturase [Pedobacter sp.]